MVMNDAYVLNESDEELSAAENLLIHCLAKISKEFDFVFGVSYMCQGEEATNEMLTYIKSHPKAGYSEILIHAVEIGEKYNSHLIADEYE